MKTRLRLATVMTALMGGLFSVMAADPVATAAIDVELMEPLVLEKVTDMQFGRVTLDGNGEGVLVLSVDNSVSATNLITGQAGGATPAAAVFSVAGSNAANYAVLVPTTSAVLSKDGSTETLTVQDFTVKLPTKAVGVTTGTIGSDNSFAVGATLTIPETQTSGMYQGSFSVSISYN